MIKTPTVFVLGAGASQPYGFPTAARLVAIAQRDGRGSVSSILGAAGFPQEEIHAFLDRLRGSGQSVDAFLERQPAFKKVGKAFLAMQLLPLEDDTSLCNAAEDVDWHRYVIAGMCPPTPSRFVGNRLKVVTFNFDRSFERRLFLMVRATYGLSDTDAAELARSVPVLHLHGHLGLPAWLDPPPGTHPARLYAPTNEAAAILACAEQIRVISDEIDPPALDQAREFLDAAEVIHFVGFGFHEDNLNRLDATRLGSKTLFGTCHGVASGSGVSVPLLQLSA